MAIPPKLAQLFLNLLVAEVDKEIDRSLRREYFAVSGVYEQKKLADNTALDPGTVDAIEFLTAQGASLDHAVARMQYACRIGLPMLRELVRLGFDINTEVGAFKHPLINLKMRHLTETDEMLEYLLEMGAQVGPSDLDLADPPVQQRVQRVLVGRSLVPLLWRVHRDLVRLVLGHLKE